MIHEEIFIKTMTWRANMYKMKADLRSMRFCWLSILLPVWWGLRWASIAYSTRGPDPMKLFPNRFLVVFKSVLLLSSFLRSEFNLSNSFSLVCISVMSPSACTYNVRRVSTSYISLLTQKYDHIINVARNWSDT